MHYITLKEVLDLKKNFNTKEMHILLLLIPPEKQEGSDMLKSSIPNPCSLQHLPNGESEEALMHMGAVLDTIYLIVCPTSRSPAYT